MFPAVDSNVFSYFSFSYGGSTTQLSGLSFNQIGLLVLLFEVFLCLFL